MENKIYARENRVYPNDENGCTSAFWYSVESVDSFTFSADSEDNSLLTVTKNGNRKTVRVDGAYSQYVYRLMKSKIEARGGVRGLVSFMERALDENFMACHAWKILDYVMDSMKPASRQNKRKKKEGKDMGWSSWHATHYRNGKVDRKAECDGYFIEGINAGFYRVHKSALVGSVYYAAVETLKRCISSKPLPDGNYPSEDIPKEERHVWAAVFLTRIDSRDYYNFYCREMSEDVGPGECECPESILKLLAPTDSRWANEWRERCRENAKKKKSSGTLPNLPVGAVIRYRQHDGTVVELLKHPPAYQFKRPFWYHKKDGTYIPSKWIPQNYEVISR